MASIHTHLPDVEPDSPPRPPVPAPSGPPPVLDPIPPTGLPSPVREPYPDTSSQSLRSGAL